MVSVMHRLHWPPADMARGQSFARSEASGLSVLEVPGAGGSLRTPSVLGGQVRSKQLSKAFHTI